MEKLIEEWDVLKENGISKEDFEDGECEVCHEKVPITSVLLTFMIWVPSEDLTKADQKDLEKEAKRKGEEVPKGITTAMDPLLGGEFCSTCLAKGLLASHLQLNIVNPKGVMASPVKAYYSEKSIAESIQANSGTDSEVKSATDSGACRPEVGAKRDWSSTH